MRESCTYGSVRGALSNERPYRDLLPKPILPSRLKLGRPLPPGKPDRRLMPPAFGPPVRPGSVG